MEEKSIKTKTSIKILIVILIVIIIGLAGFIVYQNFFDKKETKKGIQDEKIITDDNKELPFYVLEEATDLVDKYRAGLFSFADPEHSTPCDAIERVDGYNPCEEGETVYYYSTNLKGDTYESYSYDDLNKAYKELYGSNKTLPKPKDQTTPSGGGLKSCVGDYIYDEKSDLFIWVSGKCGGMSPQRNYSFSALKKVYYNENNELIVEKVDVFIEDVTKYPDDLNKKVERVYNIKLKDGKVLDYKEKDIINSNYEVSTKFINKFLEENIDNIESTSYKLVFENDRYIIDTDDIIYTPAFNY